MTQLAKLATQVACGAFALLSSVGVAHAAAGLCADFVGTPATTVYPTGIDYSTDPSLGGWTEAGDQLVLVECAADHIKAQVQMFVLSSSSNTTRDFYYRIVNNYGTTPITGLSIDHYNLHRMCGTASVPSGYEVNYRTDSLGAVGLQHVGAWNNGYTPQNDNIHFEFAGSGVATGSSSLSVFARSTRPTGGGSIYSSANLSLVGWNGSAYVTCNAGAVAYSPN